MLFFLFFPLKFKLLRFNLLFAENELAKMFLCCCVEGWSKLISSGDDNGGGVPSIINCGDGAAGEDCILTPSGGTGDKLVELFLL